MQSRESLRTNDKKFAKFIAVIRIMNNIISDRLFGSKGDDTPSNPTPIPRPTPQSLSVSAAVPANPKSPPPEQVSPRSLAQAKTNNTILVNPTLTAQNDNRARNIPAGTNRPQPVHTTSVNVQSTPSKEIPQRPKIVRSSKTAERRIQNKPTGLSSGEIGMLDKLRMRRNDKNQKVRANILRWSVVY